MSLALAMLTTPHQAYAWPKLKIKLPSLRKIGNGINRGFIDGTKSIEKGIRNGGKAIEDVAHGAGDVADDMGRKVGDAVAGAADAAADLVTVGEHGRRRDGENDRKEKESQERLAAEKLARKQEEDRNRQARIALLESHIDTLKVTIPLLKSSSHLFTSFSLKTLNQIEFLEISKLEVEKATENLALLEENYAIAMELLDTDPLGETEFTDQEIDRIQREALAKNIEELTQSLLNDHGETRTLLMGLNTQELGDLHERALLSVEHIQAQIKKAESTLIQKEQELAAHK